MTTYEQLHKKICELIPEIKELKFGAKVKINGEECIIIGGYSNLENNALESIGYLDQNYNEKRITTTEFNALKFIEIIGRDITLEDVIKCLGIISINYNGKEFKNGTYWLGSKILLIISNWQLNKPLHEQSEETQKAILDLLQ